MRWPFIAVALLAWFAGAPLAAARQQTCAAGSLEVANFQVYVRPPDKMEVKPLRSVSTLLPGYRLLYRPVDPPNDDNKKARVAVILVPLGSQAEDGEIIMLEPKEAHAGDEWEIPSRVGLLAIVYGPQGLESKKVKSMLKEDREMIAQLADYTEKSQKAEALVDALSAYDQSPNATQNLDSALRGFAASFGGGARVDRNSPLDQQALTTIRALSPALAGYDPLAPNQSVRMQQSATLAASVASLFLGSSLMGLAAGGAAMFVNLRSLMFPNTEFRSALVQSTSDHNLALCSKREPAKSRTRLAYLWALRMPNTAPPALTIPEPAHLALGFKATVPVKLADSTQWKYLDRAEDWTLQPVSGGEPVSVPVKHNEQTQSLELDLTRLKDRTGVFRLAGKWDWDSFQAQGEVHVHQLPDLKTARPSADSQDRLIERTGSVQVEMTGADFQFVEKVELRKASERSAPAIPLEFTLPKGKGGGPQETIETTIDTRNLEAGLYLMLLTQPDGVAREAPVRILPPHPKFDALPLRANLGETEQRLVFKGQGLSRIEKIEAAGAELDLAPAAEGVNQREATVRLAADATRNKRLDLLMKVEGVNQPVRVPGAIEVVGPRPKIAGVEASMPGELNVNLRDGEIPAGSFVSFSMKVENAGSHPTVRLQCKEKGLTLQAETLRSGEQHASARVRSAGQGILFLSLDSGAIGQAGCTLITTIETDIEGRSDPFTLGKVVRLPRIESFNLTNEQVGENTYLGSLKGQDLEIIEKVGWDENAGLPVSGLPAPLAGEGQKQLLRVTMPWPSPSPKAPVFVWLRGEEEGRPTKVTY